MISRSGKPRAEATDTPRVASGEGRGLCVGAGPARRDWMQLAGLAVWLGSAGSGDRELEAGGVRAASDGSMRWRPGPAH